MPALADRGNLNQPLQDGQRCSKERLIPRKNILTSKTVELSKDKAPTMLQNDSFPPGYEDDLRGGGDVWAPGFWTQFPLRGAIPFVCCLLCLSGSIAILIKSHGQPVANWSISPTVYLALLTTLTNMLLRYAFKEGVAISWWHMAMRGGTVRHLHKRWSSGDGFWSALGAGRNFDVISLGSIAVTLIAIDQPLIQRASTVISVPLIYSTNVTVAIAPEIPFGYTAYQYGRDALASAMTQPMIAAFNDFNRAVPITTGFSGCKDTCKGYIQAGGLSAQCRTTSGPAQYMYAEKLGLPLNITLYMMPQSPFSVSWGLNGSTQGTFIHLNVSYTTNGTDSCTGIRHERTCALRPATLRYPVQIQDGTLTLGDLTTEAKVQEFQPSAYSVGFSDGGSHSPWTIGGLYLAAVSLFSSEATYTFGGALGETMDLPDTLSKQFLQPTPGNGTVGATLSIPQPCTSNWNDPTSYMISALNQIAFRVSLAAATFPYRNWTDGAPTPAPQVIPMEASGSINVFHSNHKFLIANTVLTIFFMALVVPAFIGWWELGRRVTMDPIEIAKAFDAPMFQGPGSNAPMWHLIKTMGSRDVRYGEVKGYSSDGQITEKQLKLANPLEVLKPTPGIAYK